jgi:hypothetical protein
MLQATKPEGSQIASFNVRHERCDDLVIDQQLKSKRTIIAFPAAPSGYTVAEQTIEVAVILRFVGIHAVAPPGSLDSVTRWQVQSGWGQSASAAATGLAVVALNCP